MTSEPDAELAERRDAATELGAALRALGDSAVRAEVGADVLRAVTEQVRGLVPQLGEEGRARGEKAAVDSSSVRMYNPAIGPGSPIAPPMVVEFDGDVAVGTCELGLAYEGPPSYVHGGISALLLDQVLGHAHAASGRGAGMTAELTLRYRAPVPLCTPLRVVGQVVGSRHDRWTDVRAAITTQQDPETELVEGNGLFVVPSPEQAQRLFGGLRRERAVR